MPPRRQSQPPAVTADDNSSRRSYMDVVRLHSESFSVVVIPEFDGELDDDEFIDWLLQVEEIFDRNRVSDDRRVKLVINRLRGGAKIWWHQLKKRRVGAGKKKISDWLKFKKKIVAEFLSDQQLFPRVPNLQRAKQEVRRTRIVPEKPFRSISAACVEDDILGAPFDSRALFIESPEVYIPPSSGNPLFDDYTDVEIVIDQSLDDPVFDDYNDDESYSFPIIGAYVSNDCDDEGEPLYDGYEDAEDLVEGCGDEYVGPVVLSHEISFASHVPKTEELHNEMEFHVETYLDPYDSIDRRKEDIISLHGSTQFSIEATNGDAVLMVMCKVSSGLTNGKHDRQETHLLFGGCVNPYFPLLQQRHSTFGWKPGWSPL